MPTSAEMRSRLRAYLDDGGVATHSQGQFWSDAEFHAALNAAQWAVYAFLVQKKQSYLLQAMVKSVSATSNVSVPGDYAFSISGTIIPTGGADHRPAALYIGWTNRNYLYSQNHLMTAVAGSTIEWRENGVTAGVQGRLWYYKTPTAFDTGTSHTEFDQRVYDAIEYLAAAILMQKDDGVAHRGAKRFQQALRFLVAEPAGQYPELDPNLVG